MRVLLAVVVALVIGAQVGAIPPDKNKDSAAKAKAILALSSPCPECPTVTKAKSALATSGLAPVVAPMPRTKESPAATPKSEIAPRSDGTVTVSITPASIDCSSGTCHPVLPGYARGSDGVYRPNGIVPQRERR